jgi:hypothetical protein
MVFAVFGFPETTMQVVGITERAVGNDNLPTRLRALLGNQDPALTLGRVGQQVLKRRAQGRFMLDVVSAVALKCFVVSLNGFVGGLDGVCARHEEEGGSRL